MPQLDATSFPSQLFWLTVSFVVLYVLMSHALLPRVQSVMMQRKRQMDGDVEQAERLKSEAARAEEQYEQALSEARSKSQSMLMEAQNEIRARETKRRQELDALIEAKLAESDIAITNAKQGVSGRVAPVAGELASLIVEVLVHQKPDSKALGNAISELSKEKSL